MKHTTPFAVTLCTTLFTCLPAQAESIWLPTQPLALEATPYRPTVSNPAELSVPGYLEIEAGWRQSHADDLRTQSMQYLAKYALNNHWGVLLGGDAWTRQRSAGDSVSGTGDSFFSIKHLFDLDLKDQGLGVEVGVTLPTAQHGMGSAQSDYVLNGIHSIDLTEHWRLDTNVGVTHLGAPEDNTGRNVLLWVSCLGYSTGYWGYAIEFAGTHQTSVANTKQVLIALSYAVTPRLVVDTALIHMWQAGNSERSWMFGATWLMGKLF